MLDKFIKIGIYGKVAQPLFCQSAALLASVTNGNDLTAIEQNAVILRQTSAQPENTYFNASHKALLIVLLQFHYSKYPYP
jgi:hypothetical protein